MHALRYILLSVLLVATFPGRAATAGDSGLLTSERLVAGVTEQLAHHFNLEGDLQVELLRPWSAPGQSASDWRVEVLEFPATAASSMLLRVRVFGDGQTVVPDATLVLRASLWRDAWGVREPVLVNATFDATSLEPRRIDAFRERDALPVTAGDRTFIFARSVSAGRLLTWRDIARRPLVRKGEFVEVSASDGLLSVTLKGLAMQNGAQGDVITVRNPDSRKDFSAFVVDENRVQVRF